MLHMSTLQHKQVKSQKQHLKILWGRGAEGRHMGPRAGGREKQIPHRFFKNEFMQQILYGTHYFLDVHQTVIQMLLEDFPLPSLSLLSKIGKGKIDAIKDAQALKKDGKISEDICLLFDKMYL